MRLTTRTQYALIGLYYLKNHSDRVVKLAEIADIQNLSLHYLEQLFMRLRRAGIAKSIRGPGGGYSLVSKGFTLRDVMDAVGEPLELYSGELDTKEKIMTSKLLSKCLKQLPKAMENEVV